MPDRRTLFDADGVAIASFIPVHRGGRDVADLLELDVSVQQALPAILEQLAGWRVAGPVELGRALVAAGGMPARHAHSYSHDLRGERPQPHPPAGMTLTGADRPAADLLPAYLAAHPPDHVDWPVIAGEDSTAHLAKVMAGAYGRLLDSSGLAIAADGRVVGGILVAELADPEPPFEGAWVMELFREPGARGAGRALLERALALTPGPALGLAVTDGNPAARLYERLGFRRVLSAFSVDL
jgi:GNAT superfamily N-acetyltransferase